jgi:hypothetical protein
LITNITYKFVPDVVIFQDREDLPKALKRLERNEGWQPFVDCAEVNILRFSLGKKLRNYEPKSVPFDSFGRSQPIKHRHGVEAKLFCKKKKKKINSFRRLREGDQRETRDAKLT